MNLYILIINIQRNDMLEKAADFIKKNGSKKTVIIYDTDSDGIGSAAIIAKTIKRLYKKIPEALPSDHSFLFISEKMFREIKSKKFDLIIIVDMAIDEKPEYVLRLAKKSKILIIDHHQTYDNLNRYKNILHINPGLWKINIPSSEYCTCKLAYDICNKITDIEDLDWVAGMGIIFDMCEKRWKSFLEGVFRKHNITCEKLGEVSNILTAGYRYSGSIGARIGYEACLESDSPLDVFEARTINSKKLKRFDSVIEKEIKSIENNWKKSAEIIEDKKLIILKLNTRFAVSSPISTFISLKKPNYTVFVFRKKGKFTYMSLRRQDKKVNCGKIAIELTKGLGNSSGGGHIPAAGVHIMSKDWKEIRKRMLKMF